MRVFLAVFTYFAYVFIVVMYAAKIVKYLSLPVHLRWELYPIVHDERSHYGGSYQEKALKVPGVRWRSFMKELAYLSKDYLFMVSYFKWRKSYWVFLPVAREFRSPHFIPVVASCRGRCRGCPFSRKRRFFEQSCC